MKNDGEQETLDRMAYIPRIVFPLGKNRKIKFFFFFETVPENALAVRNEIGSAAHSISFANYGMTHPQPLPNSAIAGGDCRW